MMRKNTEGKSKKRVDVKDDWCQPLQEFLRNTKTKMVLAQGTDDQKKGSIAPVTITVKGKKGKPKIRWKAVVEDDMRRGLQ